MGRTVRDPTPLLTASANATTACTCLAQGRSGAEQSPSKSLPHLTSLLPATWSAHPRVEPHCQQYHHDPLNLYVTHSPIYCPHNRSRTLGGIHTDWGLTHTMGVLYCLSYRGKCAPTNNGERS